MITLRRWARMHFYVLWSTAKRLQWILVSLAAAAIGTVDLFTPVPQILVIATAVVAFLLLILEVANHIKRRRSTIFQPRTADTFTDVKKALEDNDRFRILEWANGTFVHDNRVSFLIQEGRLSARLAATTTYIAPPEIRHLGERYLEQHLDDAKRNQREVWDDAVVGWNTNIGFENDFDVQDIEMTPSSFYHRLRTDDFSMNDVMQSGSARPEYGRQLFINRLGRLRDFGSSWLLNGIGTSTLAFTSDGKLVLVEQSKRNARSQGLFAPSGSGSLEPQDFAMSPALDLRDLAANGANRELAEETGIRREEIVTSQFLGFGRWLEKAACPELFTLTLLSVHSDDLGRRSIPSSDRRLVESRKIQRLIGTSTDWDHAHPESLLPVDYRGRLSVPLSTALSLFILAVQNPNDTVRDWIRET
jgi:8-oxo-dGTP pyrophosphatase MutT (NUDIX family)